MKNIHNSEVNTEDMKRHVLPVEVDEHGECFLTLPDELLDEMGGSEGTLIEWSEDIDGTVIMRGVEE